MQRNYRFLWLALIPLGAAGALATGIVPMPWQSTDEQSQATARSAPPSTSPAEARKQAAVRTEPQEPSATSAANSAKADADKLRSFGVDVARISEVGSSVIAGYGKPGSPMTVMADGKPMGVVTPDAKGDWVLITPHKFADLDPKISLSIGDQTRKTVAALDSAAKTPNQAVTEPKRTSAGAPKVATEPKRTSAGAPKRRAAEVTEQMLLRLKQLTAEANAESRARAAPAVSNELKSPQQVASLRPSPNAPSRNKTAVTGSAPGKPATTPSQIGQTPITPPPGSAPPSAASGPAMATAVRTPTASPVTVSPVTVSPGTTAPGTEAPGTAAPVTASPVTTSPVTTSPVTTSPVTTSPVTTSPGTTSPGTAAPDTAAPGVIPRQIATAAPSASQTLSSKTVSGQSAAYLPVPVQFVYRQAELTAQGREAAVLLLNYFNAKNFQAVVLSGHADERGSTSANKALSQRRLLRIRDLLRAGGFKGHLELVPKGETEKYMGVDRSQFEAEELYQLDRRVEVMSAR